jgi:uncharacterized membrane protein YhdT
MYSYDLASIYIYINIYQWLRSSLRKSRGKGNRKEILIINLGILLLFLLFCIVHIIYQDADLFDLETDTERFVFLVFLLLFLSADEEADLELELDRFL